MNKKILRSHFLEKRKNLSQKRRNLAIEKGIFELKKLSESHDFILSYASFRDEFCTRRFNNYLVLQGKLLLPKVTSEGLKIYHVKDINSLEYNAWGIAEPDEKESFPFSKITLSLIPGIAFDASNQRIGYGKGYYDRFLAQCPHFLSIGIGFEEQYSLEAFPHEKHDIPLSHLMLF